MPKLLPISTALLLLACSPDPTSPAYRAADASYASIFTNGPPSPGNSYIVRGTYGDWFMMGSDPKTQLAVWLTDDDFECADFAQATPQPYQDIFNPADEGLVMHREGGWINALVIAPPYECGDILAQGLVRITAVDNDMLSPYYPHHRANRGGWSLSGRVGRYTVSWNLVYVWGGLTKPDHVQLWIERIMVKPN